MKPLIPEEIAIKIYYKNQLWLYGKPKVVVKGENKTFGEIRFEFPKEKPVVIRAYLYNKDQITKDANEAVDNFTKIIQNWYVEMARR